MRDAWLAGWADQKAFAGCETASRKRSRAKPGSNRFADADKIEALGRFIRATTTPPPRRKEAMSGNINDVVASQQAQAAVLKRIADTQTDHAARLTQIETRLNAIEATLDAIAATLAAISARLP